MIGMWSIGRIVMTSSIGKALSRTISTLMNVKCKETRTTPLGQPSDIRYNQDATALLIESNFSGQVRCFRATPYISNRIRTGRTTLHRITSYPAYAWKVILMNRFPAFGYPIAKTILSRSQQGGPEDGKSIGFGKITLPFTA